MYKNYQIRPYVVLQIVIVERPCTAVHLMINITTKPHKFSSKNCHFRKMHESPTFEKISTKLILKNN